MGAPWTDRAVNILTAEWYRGSSAREIAELLPGDYTRSAVVGKAMRLGLKTRRHIQLGAPKAAPPKVSAKTNCIRLKRKVGRGFAPSFEVTETTDTASHSDGAIPLAQRKQLLDLTPSCCRWPVGDPGTPGFFFCGGVAVEGGSYCLSHAKRAYAGRGNVGVWG